MTRDSGRQLAVAVRNSRVGFVLLMDGEPMQWGKSRLAFRGATAAARILRDWISRTHPNVVIVEEPQTARRKGRRSKAVMRRLAATAEKSGLDVLIVPRAFHHPNLYREMRAFVERFPIMGAVAAQARRLWDSEDPNYVYFEALALAQSAGAIVMDD